jgi:hypothetical protein
MFHGMGMQCEIDAVALLTVDGAEEEEEEDSAVDGGLGAVKVIDKLSRTRLPAL